MTRSGLKNTYQGHREELPYMNWRSDEAIRAVGDLFLQSLVQIASAKNASQ